MSQSITRPGICLSDVAPEDPWPIVRGVAYEGKLTFLAGREGFGKSTLIRQCAAGVALGLSESEDNDFLSPLPARRGSPVLWIGEESPAALATAFDSYGDDCAEKIVAIDPDSLTGPCDLRDAVDAWRPDLIVVDPAADLYRMEDERDYTRVRATIRQWYPPAVETGTTLRHDAHGDWQLRGEQWYRWERDDWRRWDGTRDDYDLVYRVVDAWSGHDGGGWHVEREYLRPAMIGVLHCHRDRDARAGGGDQVGAYLGSVGYGSACDVLLEMGVTDRKDASDTGRYLRVCKSRLPGLRRGHTTHLAFEDGRYLRRTAGAGLLSDRDRECSQIAAETREFRARNPDASKAQAMRYLGVSRGGGPKYRAFDQAWNKVTQ